MIRSTSLEKAQRGDLVDVWVSIYYSRDIVVDSRLQFIVAGLALYVMCLKVPPEQPTHVKTFFFSNISISIPITLINDEIKISFKVFDFKVDIF